MDNNRIGYIMKLFVLCLISGVIGFSVLSTSAFIGIVFLLGALVSGIISGLLFYKEVFKGV